MRICQHDDFVASRFELLFQNKHARLAQTETDELREGAFRDDFCYRLLADIVTIPALRQRLFDPPEEPGELLTDTEVEKRTALDRRVVCKHIENDVDKSG